MELFRKAAALTIAALAASAPLIGAGNASAAGSTYPIPIGTGTNKCMTPYGGY